MAKKADISLPLKNDKMPAKRIVLSDESVNCYGTWISTAGMDITQYEKNPVLLWMHERGYIIGCIKDIRKESDGRITGEPFFDEVREESKLLKQQWEKGTLRMASVYVECIETSDAPELRKPGQYREAVTKSKLVETSMVDIGGNDNALPLMLTTGGKELKLSAAEDNASLPLLHNNKQQKKDNRMDLKTIALKLGLPETATEQEILNAIGVLLGYKTANETLRREKEALELAGITGLVDAAIVAKKITADKKAAFIELGKKAGADSLKLAFDAITPVQKPMDVIHNAGGGSLSLAGNWKKLSEVPAEELLELRENDKDAYMRLYKAEYGVECPKY